MYRLRVTDQMPAQQGAQRFGCELVRLVNADVNGWRYLVRRQESHELYLMVLLQQCDDFRQLTSFVELYSDEPGLERSIVDMFITESQECALLLTHIDALPLRTAVRNRRFTTAEVAALLIGVIALAKRVSQTGAQFNEQLFDSLLVDSEGGLHLAGPACLDVDETRNDALQGIELARMLELMDFCADGDSVAVLRAAVESTFLESEGEDLLEVACHNIARVITPMRLVLPTVPQQGRAKKNAEPLLESVQESELRALSWTKFPNPLRTPQPRGDSLPGSGIELRPLRQRYGDRRREQGRPSSGLQSRLFRRMKQRPAA